MNNILFIAGLVGPRLDYALPRIAKYGQIYAYIARELPVNKIQELEKFSAEIISGKFLTADKISQEEVVQDIIITAKRIKAHAIVALDEYSIAPASLAAASLGLRGAGKNIALSRNKYAMREAFHLHKVPSPKYHLINNINDLTKAYKSLKFPFLMKVTEGSGSRANIIIYDEHHAQESYKSLYQFVLDMGKDFKLGVVDSFLKPQFIAEEIIESTTESWDDTSGYGDYVSVEGIVAAGQYYPISITSRMPTIYPFIETAIQTPCVLKPELQYKIVRTAKSAVDALQLQYCATHTEIKLMKDQQLCLIESAARVPGASITRIIENSFGIDFIGLLIELLITGKTTHLPSELITDYKIASGVVAMLPTDALGNPWKSRPKFTRVINLKSIIPEEIKYEVDWTPSLQEGALIPEYDPQRGQWNYLGGVFMSCNDPKLLIKAQHNVLNYGEDLFLKNE